MAFRADGIGVLGMPARLVDDARSVVFESAGTTAMGRRDVFRLGLRPQTVMVWVSPLEIGEDGVSRVRRDLEVGHRTILGPGRDYPAAQFGDPSEKAFAESVAIEALIAYGMIFDGLTAPDGLFQVEHRGRYFRASDFE